MKYDREKSIIRTSIIGVIANVVLVAFKAVVGIFANSIAIILDAVNNLSDALSSVITIVGTKLSSKAPDKKHPYGYGRIEYITSVVIAVIVLLAGVTSLRESAVKIFEPQQTDYSVPSVVVIAAAIVAKIIIGKYFKSQGEKLNSQSLTASGADALFDAILSGGTLVTAVVSMLWGISLEGIMGVLISIIIIKSGVEILTDTLNSIIGVRADKELTDNLKEKINSFDGVKGTFDLTLHNYGPSKIMGTAHVEVADSMSAKEIHRLTRRISTEVFVEFGIVLTLGIYASNDTGRFAEIKKTVQQIVTAHKEVLQMHGFYADDDTKSVSFDIIVDFDADADDVRDSIKKEVSEKFSEYNLDIVLDSDYSD